MHLFCNIVITGIWWTSHVLAAVQVYNQRFCLVVWNGGFEFGIRNGNLFDPYAVAIKKGSEVIGHIPRKISPACFLFLEMSGTLTCEITDSNHQYSFDLPQGGMQISCKLIFRSRDLTLMTVPLIELKCKQRSRTRWSLRHILYTVWHVTIYFLFVKFNSRQM